MRKIPLRVYGLLLIIVGLVAGIILLGNRQLFPQSASTTPIECTPENNQVIDFESVPGITNTELATVNTQYPNITFRNGRRINARDDLDYGACSSSYPLLAKKGNPMVAFLNDAQQVGDKPNSLANGNWFLTDDGVVDEKMPCSLLVTYAIPTTQLSFELIDIDNAEGWEVRPFDANGTLISSLVKRVTYQNTNITGDSVSTKVSIISTDSQPISQIRILPYVDPQRINGWGLAFDNFSTYCANPPTASPTPAPTGTPTTPPMCRIVDLYTNTWTPISTSQALQLTPPQTIFIAVAGTGSGTFDKARFSVNSGPFQESTTLNQFGEYYIPFTITSGMTNLSVAAQVHQVETNQWY